MATRSILLTEARQLVGSSLYKKLSGDAKRLVRLLSVAFAQQKLTRFTVNMIRNTGMFRSTKTIRNLLYELESRDFGDIEVNGAEVTFTVNEPILRSISRVNESLEAPENDDDRFGNADPFTAIVGLERYLNSISVDEIYEQEHELEERFWPFGFLQVRPQQYSRSPVIVLLDNDGKECYRLYHEIYQDKRTWRRYD